MFQGTLTIYRIVSPQQSPGHCPVLEVASRAFRTSERMCVCVCVVSVSERHFRCSNVCGKYFCDILSFEPLKRVCVCVLCQCLRDISGTQICGKYFCDILSFERLKHVCICASVCETFQVEQMYVYIVSISESFELLKRVCVCCASV